MSRILVDSCFQTLENIHERTLFTIYWGVSLIMLQRKKHLGYINMHVECKNSNSERTSYLAIIFVANFIILCVNWFKISIFDVSRKGRVWQQAVKIVMQKIWNKIFVFFSNLYKDIFSCILGMSLSGIQGYLSVLWSIFSSWFTGKKIFVVFSWQNLQKRNHLVLIWLLSL